jgi:hypothetical protein
MDLIERYVAAVGRQLPARQAGDIEAELRDELLTRVEAREAELGRPLGRPELEALLRDFGHPLVVAGRYGRTQHLIGPETYPFWSATVKWTMATTAAVYVALVSLAMATGKTAADLKGAGPSFVGVALQLFGVVTVAFALFERFGKTAFLNDWKPSRLPPAGGRRRSAFELSAEIVLNLVFLAWWFGALKFRDLVPAPSFLSISLAPVWAAWRWPIAAYSLAETAANAVAIARPGWVRFNGGAVIVRAAFGIAILSQVLRAGHWVQLGASQIPPHALAEAQRNFDLAMRAGIVLTMVGLAVRAGLEAWRLHRRRRAAGVVLNRA